MFHSTSSSISVILQLRDFSKLLKITEQVRCNASSGSLTADPTEEQHNTLNCLAGSHEHTQTHIQYLCHFTQAVCIMCPVFYTYNK